MSRSAATYLRHTRCGGCSARVKMATHVLFETPSIVYRRHSKSRLEAWQQSPTTRPTATAQNSCGIQGRRSRNFRRKGDPRPAIVTLISLKAISCVTATAFEKCIAAAPASPAASAALPLLLAESRFLQYHFQAQEGRKPCRQNKANIF